VKNSIKPFRLATYAFFFSLNFESFNLFGLGIDYLSSKITIIGLVLVSILNYRGVVNVSQRRLFLFVPLVIFFLLLTVMNYCNRIGGFMEWFNTPLAINILIFIILTNLSIIYNDVLLKGFLALSIGTFFLSVLFIFGIGVEHTPDERFTIFYENPNYLGIRSSIALLTLIYVIFYNKLEFGKNRFWFLLLFPTLIILLVCTGSRVSFISLVFGIIIFLFHLTNKISANKLIILLGLILTFIFIWIFYLKESVIIERLNNFLFKGDLANRDLIWTHVINILKCDPLFGIGETGYNYAISQVMGSVGSPHNLFFELVCYTGIIGLLIFLVFFLQIIRVAVKSFFEDKDNLPVIYLVPIVGLALIGQILDQKIAWILFSYIASRSLNKSKVDKEESGKKEISIHF
jgi:O-antigen ligase